MHFNGRQPAVWAVKPMRLRTTLKLIWWVFDYWGHVLLGATGISWSRLISWWSVFFPLLVKIEISGHVSYKTHALEMAQVSFLWPSHVRLTCFFSRCGSSKFCKFYLLPNHIIFRMYRWWIHSKASYFGRVRLVKKPVKTLVGSTRFFFCFFFSFLQTKYFIISKNW